MDADGQELIMFNIHWFHVFNVLVFYTKPKQMKMEEEEAGKDCNSGKVLCAFPISQTGK